MNLFYLVAILVVLIGATAAQIPTVRYCRPGDSTPGCSQCPDDSPWVECDVVPCVREEEFGCPLFKGENTTCISNQCGGCADEWYLPSGRRVWCWGP